jgi:hypothetical protein
MSTFITTSITWGGKENMDYFLKPMFIGRSPWETDGVRVIPNVQSSMKLNYFGTVSKILKAYAKGFNAASGTTYTQRTLSVHRMKAEAADDALDFYQTVFEQGLRTDDWNNLDGTALKNIIIELYRNAVKSDVFRQFWLNDENKETLDSNGFFSGTADTDYNAFQGMWSLLMENADTSPSSTQIYRKSVSDGAVAQVDTITLTTGSSGNLIITLMGVDYTTAHDTDHETTATNFVSDHAADIALRGVTVTSSTDDLIFTSSIAGQPFDSPEIEATSDITASGGTVNTIANTAPSALTAGESEDIFLDLYVNADKVLKQVPAPQKVLLVTDLVLENYITYLESLGTERAHMQLENGQAVYYYRGIRIVNPGWDVHLEADFPHDSGDLPAYPHRVIYTTLDNLVLGLDALSQFNETKMWYNEDEEENRFRTKLVMGCQFVHNKLVAVAY